MLVISDQPLMRFKFLVGGHWRLGPQRGFKTDESNCTFAVHTSNPNHWRKRTVFLSRRVNFADLCLTVRLTILITELLPHTSELVLIVLGTCLLDFLSQLLVRLMKVWKSDRLLLFILVVTVHIIVLAGKILVHHFTVSNLINIIVQSMVVLMMVADRA